MVIIAQGILVYKDSFLFFLAFYFCALFIFPSFLDARIFILLNVWKVCKIMQVKKKSISYFLKFALYTYSLGIIYF